MLEKYVKTEGIIISSLPYLECSSILKILSSELGKVSAIARGARKTTSKRAGVLQPFNTVLFELYRGKSFYTVVQARSLRNRIPISSNYEKTLCAYFACELISKTLEEEQSIKGVFEILDAYLSILESVSKESAFVYLAGFSLAYLKLLGYKFALEECAVCGKKFSDTDIAGLRKDPPQLICCEPERADFPEKSTPADFKKTLEAALRATVILEKKAGMKPSYEFSNQQNPGPLKRESFADLIDFFNQFISAHLSVELISHLQLSQAIERML